MASPSVARTRRVPANLESDDVVAMRAAELGAWAQRNARTIAVVAAVAAAIVLAVVGYSLLQQRKAASAAAAYLELQATAPAGPQGLQAMERFVAQHNGTPEAAEARLALAGLYLDGNQPQKAVAHAREVARSGGALEYQGQMMLGTALLRANDRPGALAAYREAANEAGADFQRFDALSAAALAQETAGEWQGAVDTYRRLLALTKEGSMDRSVVEMRMAEAEGHLAGARR
jgi:tetratricopeptide (TPR) repeat protein